MYRCLAGMLLRSLSGNQVAHFIQRVRTLTEFRTMSVAPYPIQCYRDGKWEQIQTDKLLPGDLVSVVPQQTETTVPADLLLVHGTCIVNEAMLSGESTPLLKESIQLLDLSENLDVDGTHKNAVLFSGTKILHRTNRPTGQNAGRRLSWCRSSHWVWHRSGSTCSHDDILHRARLRQQSGIIPVHRIPPNFCYCGKLVCVDQRCVFIIHLAKEFRLSILRKVSSATSRNPNFCWTAYSLSLVSYRLNYPWSCPWP